MSREVDRAPVMRLVSPPREGPLPRPGSSSIVMPLRQRTASAISLFIDIGQGAGTAGAAGIRPFPPALLTGALAANDTGIDFDGTDYSFLEQPAFLFVIVALAVLVFALERRGSQVAGRSRGLQLGVAVVAVVLGALLFAGSLAADGETSWWGLPAGVVCAALGYLAVAALFGRART